MKNRQVLLSTFTCILLLTTVFLASYHPIVNSDLGFHLAAGQWMDEQGGVPRVDDFSYTAQGTTWRDFEWLYQRWVIDLWHLGGPTAVTVAHALVNVLTFGLLIWALGGRSRMTLVGLSLLVMALLVCEVRFSVRPHAVGRFLFAATLWVLLYPRSRGRPIPVWPLAIIMVLWCNLHGSYTAGIILSLFLMLDAVMERKGWARATGLFVLLLVASCCNPYGWQQNLGLFVHHDAVRQASANPEWQPLALTPAVLADPGLWAFVILAVLTSWLVWGKRGRSLGWFERAVWLMCLFAPFVHVRTLPLSAIALTLLSAVVLLGEEEKPAGFPGLAVALVGVLLFSTNLYWKWAPRSSRLGTGVSEQAVGWGAGKFLAEKEGVERVFNTYASGGWLMWWLYPQGGRVYIDGRDVGNVYTPENFTEYLELLTQPAQFAGARDKYDWDAVVLEPGNPLCQPLIQHLEKTGQWIPAYADVSSIVYLPPPLSTPQPLNP